MIGICLPSQSASDRHNQEKEPTNLCTPREVSPLPTPRSVSAMFDNHNQSTFCALWTLFPRIKCAKDHSLFFNLNYPQISEVRKSDCMAYIEVFISFYFGWG